LHGAIDIKYYYQQAPLFFYSEQYPSVTKNHGRLKKE
jgi:hypothetical protein